MKKFRITTFGVIAIAVLSFETSTHAVPYVLKASTGTIVSGNQKSNFYEVSGTGVESGTAEAVSFFSSTLGGSGSPVVGPGVGFTVKYSWDPNSPQPLINYAFIKAGPKYLEWDATDFAAFNSGDFDSIVLFQDGILNNPGRAFLGISHSGLEGEIRHQAVPDSSSSVALLGMAAGALAFVARSGRKVTSN